MMNHFKNLNSRLGKTFPPEPIGADKIRQMLDGCSYKPSGKPTISLVSKRDKALIAVLWRSGLRIAEALSLEPKNISYQKAEISILHAKGDEFGLAGMDQLTKGIILEWKDARSTLKPKRGRPLFCTIKGGHHGPIHYNNVRTMVKKRALDAGIEQRIAPHSFRHCFARELVNEGKTLFEVQQALRHKNPVTTYIYLTWLANDLGTKAVQGRGEEPVVSDDEIQAVLSILKNLDPKALQAALENL